MYICIYIYLKYIVIFYNIYICICDLYIYMGKSQTDPTQKRHESGLSRAGVSACCPRLCCPTDFGRPMLILRNSNFSKFGFGIGGLEI